MSESAPRTRAERSPGSSGPAREHPPVDASRRSAAEIAAADNARERLSRNAEAGQRKREQGHGNHEHVKRPNFFQEHTKKIMDAPKEKTVGKGVKKALKSAALLGLGAGVVVEGAAAVALMDGTAGLGAINYFSTMAVGHPVISASVLKGTTFLAGHYLAPAGLALGAPWIITNVLEAINKYVGGAKISSGGGGGASHGGGGGH